MELGEIIRAAIVPIVSICDPAIYTGDAAEYTTYSFTELPDNYGDDAPGAMRYLVQVHWFLPAGINPEGKKRRIKQALFAAGMTYPEVENASELDVQHFIFECEATDGNI